MDQSVKSDIIPTKWSGKQLFLVKSTFLSFDIFLEWNSKIFSYYFSIKIQKKYNKIASKIYFETLSIIPLL